MSTKIGPNDFIFSIRSYKLTHPSSVLGGKNSKLTQGGEPGSEAALIFSLILTTEREVGCKMNAVEDGKAGGSRDYTTVSFDRSSSSQTASEAVLDQDDDFLGPVLPLYFLTYCVQATAK